jgi:hypothetical protein
LTNLAGNRYLFVAENKSLPNREAPMTDHAVGRPLAIAWFEQTYDEADGELGGDVVVPCDRDAAGSLKLVNSTIAEIARAAGYYPVVGSNVTERDVEIIHEREFLNHGIVQYDCVRARNVISESGDTEHWAFSLSAVGYDVEDVAFESRDFAALTKMGMARMIQLRDGLDDNRRSELWSRYTKTALAAEITNAGGVPLAIAAPAAPAAPAVIGAAAPAVPAAPAAAAHPAGKGVVGRGRGG